MDSVDDAKVFLEDTSGPPQYSAVFEATNGSEQDTPIGGYLYLSDRAGQRILKHLEIYRDPALAVKESDVRIFWSSDGSKCGVAIWGRMRGIIDIAKGCEIAALLEGRESPAITDSEWLVGFEMYLDEDQFIRVRQRFWKEMARAYRPDARPKPENETPIETNFVLHRRGPENLFAVFEDNAETGYLYLYDSSRHQILEHLHVYDRSKKLRVISEDVEVAWSEGGMKCGVVVFQKMRGIIDRQQERPGRAWMEDRNTPGIDDPEWLKGFEYLFSDPN